VKRNDLQGCLIDRRKTIESSDLGYPVSHYVKRVPGSRGASRLHPATITRWILKGVNTPIGRIRLEAKKVGVRWMITEADFAEFLAKLTAATLPDPPVGEPSVSPARRRKEIDAASRKLDELLKSRK